MKPPPTSSKGRARANGPSPLRQTATRLAEAAANLSAAAQAMSRAAGQLSAANHASLMGVVEPPQPIESDQVSGSPIPDKKSVENGASDEECTNPEDSDYYISGGNLLIISTMSKFIASERIISRQRVHTY
jgi:hypothetical protein